MTLNLFGSRVMHAVWTNQKICNYLHLKLEHPFMHHLFAIIKSKLAKHVTSRMIT